MKEAEALEETLTATVAELRETFAEELEDVAKGELAAEPVAAPEQNWVLPPSACRTSDMPARGNMRQPLMQAMDPPQPQTIPNPPQPQTIQRDLANTCNPAGSISPTKWTHLDSSDFNFHSWPNVEEGGQCYWSFCMPAHHACGNQTEPDGSLKTYPLKKFVDEQWLTALLSGNGASADDLRRAQEIVSKEMGHHILLNNARLIKDPALHCMLSLVLIECPWQIPIAPCACVTASKVVEHPDLRELTEAYYKIPCCQRIGCIPPSAKTSYMAPLQVVTKNRVESQLNSLFAGKLRFQIENTRWITKNGNLTRAWHKIGASRATGPMEQVVLPDGRVAMVQIVPR